ncbi:hypothetical protein HHK36_021603 [Tetracentron sinense]|uniref:BAH domain-containing protein n=1 Tax=Tetracentron sinense TaxID=13715 RepID=A0A834YU00_TETSI|nr:hypothetical protein HHK36_021603 [Tetracentron sinense]
MPAMACSEEAAKLENYEFKWGKKRGVGGKKKDIQFYESFTYDGVDYFLYDCVYLHKEGEPEPFIGKLVKIWEQPDHKKKVKVLWFFYPVEILNWLGDDVPLENELFLASGEGVGLANVNSLEVIAGKCNVICTSKDSRNPHPSEEELEMADYIFYRTFDVQQCTILDKIDEKVAGVEVRFIFNRKEDHKSSDIPKLDAVRNEKNGNTVAINEAPQLLSELNSSGELKNITTDYKFRHSVIKEDADAKDSLVKQEPLLGEKLASGTDAQLNQTATTDFKQQHVSDGKTKPRHKYDSDEDEGKAGKKPINQVEDNKKLKSGRDLGALDNRSSKKARLDSSARSSEEPEPNISSLSALDKDRNNNSILKKLRGDSDEDKTKFRLVKDSLGLEKDASKKVKSDEKASKLSNGTLHKAAAAHAPEKDFGSDGPELEVARRPDAPWEERMQTAHEQGTLVLLENLDPAYTSAEVEDIVWHGFREYCTAKVVQRTAISSPHSGQAFVIFKTLEAAEMMIRKLDEGCLMLPNGRPLVGSRGTYPRLLGKQSTFAGHLFIDKVKFQMQREEMKRAVSTSHCSQPNTIEYEMAMEWSLLQARSDSWWKKLYKQHGEELRKHKANLKSK